MKSVIICFAAILLLISIPFVYESIDDVLTDDLTLNFAGVSTGAGLFSANVTLSRDLFNDNIANVTGVSSNVTSDTPTAYSFNQVSRILEISGLEDGVDRTISVEFHTDADLITTMSTVFVLLRWFYLFIIIGMCGGAVYAFFD